MIGGQPAALLSVAESLAAHWTVKVRAELGPERMGNKIGIIVNRVVRWSEDCLLYEADPRHVKKLL